MISALMVLCFWVWVRVRVQIRLNDFNGWAWREKDSLVAVMMITVTDNKVKTMIYLR